MVFEACPSRWTAEYHYKGGQPSSSAANLGTACHGGLEDFVKQGHHTNGGTVVTLHDLFLPHYRNAFPTDERLEEGQEMLTRWYARNMPWDTDRKVLSTETKESFMVPSPVGDITFNYIWDRCDELPNGEIEVTDYKTVARPISPESLKDNIQARCYALAAQIRFPDAPRVWVTFDLLRHDPVGVVFSRDQNIATWKYVKNVAQRILDTDGNNAPEQLNSMCHWCVRKTVCTALRRHVEAGGVLALADIDAAAKLRMDLENARKGLDAAMGEVDEFVLNYMETEDVLEFETDEVQVAVTAKKSRSVDGERVKQIVGEEIAGKYGSIGVTVLDKILKEEAALTDEQRAELKALVGVKFSDPRVIVSPKNPIDTAFG